jgi:tetratricopeptide (TPR) repeat protein
MGFAANKMSKVRCFNEWICLLLTLFLAPASTAAQSPSPSMDAEAYVNRGIAYGKNGYEAISDYNKALELNPSHAMAYVARGAADGSKGQYDQAIFDYNNALEISPRSAKFS